MADIDIAVHRRRTVLRYGVLGLLIERRGYGYELVQRLAARLGAAWRLTPSAVYTALDQLEEAALIEAVPAADAGAVEIAGSAAARRAARRTGRVVYRATERGAAEFEAWLARPSARVEPVRSELALKVALAAPDTVPALLASIVHEERMILQSLQEEHGGAREDRAPAPAPSRARAVAPLRVVEAEPTVAAGRGLGLASDGRAVAWPAAASALVSAAASTRLEGELAWLATVRVTLQRMLRENVSGVAGAASQR
jgi:DNA-binding PadR family transcriptional regulator